MTLLVREATRADRDAIAACLRGGVFRDDEIAVALELVDGGFAGDPDYALVVAEEGGAVVGYACFGATPMTRAAFDLYWIVVAAAARGRGAGTAILAAVEAAVRARGGGAIRVETSAAPAYAPARRLYARTGYPEIALLADFYAPGEPMIVYYKVL
jgi:ribosomal protein S18 acetylase RimI-like enzyme